MQFLTNLNLLSNELQNAVIQVLAKAQLLVKLDKFITTVQIRH